MAANLSYTGDSLGDGIRIDGQLKPRLPRVVAGSDCFAHGKRDRRVQRSAATQLKLLGRNVMNRIGMYMRTTVALLLLAIAPPWSGAIAQASLKDQIVGTWTYVSVDLVRPGGTREPLFGPNPQGQASFDGNGRYQLMTARAAQTRFASNNRMEGTAEEYKAVVQGSIAHFGRYTVDEMNKTITFRIEASTFPNWNGTEQKRPFTVAGDELTWRTPASTGSGIAEVVLKRAK